MDNIPSFETRYSLIYAFLRSANGVFAYYLLMKPCKAKVSFSHSNCPLFRPEAALVWSYIPATALELEQQLIILATKPTKKHEILSFFFVRFRGFRGHHYPIKEIKFLYRSDWPFFRPAAALTPDTRCIKNKPLSQRLLFKIIWHPPQFAGIIKAMSRNNLQLKKKWEGFAWNLWLPVF